MALDCLANIIKHCGTDMTTTVDLINDIFNLDATPKVVVDWSDDPVALACAAHRSGQYQDLTQIIATDQDREQAAVVRRHFLDKLVIQRLRGQPVSEFRSKLGAFLAGNRPIYKDEIGIVYQLPYFYFEDLEHQALIETTEPVQPQQAESCKISLKPKTIVAIRRRRGAGKQFWWTDQQNRPYVISVRDTSESMMLYQSIWRFPEITVESRIYAKSFMGTDRYHFKLVNTRLLGVGHG